MTDEQKAAYAYSMAICALAEMESMKVSNARAVRNGRDEAYGEEAFAALPNKHGIHHNALIELFHNYR